MQVSEMQEIRKNFHVEVVVTFFFNFRIKFGIIHRFLSLGLEV